MDEKIYHLCWSAQRISNLCTTVFIIMPSSGASFSLQKLSIAKFALFDALRVGKGAKSGQNRVFGVA